MPRHFSGTFEGTISGGGLSGLLKLLAGLAVLGGALVLLAPVAAATTTIAAGLATAITTAGLFLGIGGGAALAVGGSYWLVRRVRAAEDNRRRVAEFEANRRRAAIEAHTRRPIPMSQQGWTQVEATRLDREVR